MLSLTHKNPDRLRIGGLLRSVSDRGRRVRKRAAASIFVKRRIARWLRDRQREIPQKLPSLTLDLAAGSACVRKYGSDLLGLNLLRHLQGTECPDFSRPIVSLNAVRGDLPNQRRHSDVRAWNTADSK